MTELGLEIVEISARGDRVVTVDRNHTKLALYEIKFRKVREMEIDVNITCALSAGK